MSLVERPAVRRRTVRARITAVDDGRAVERHDRIVGEEPLEIRAAGPGQEAVRVAVTMRTPGNDYELAAGFLFTEGLLTSRDEISSIRYCGLDEAAEQRFNVVTVQLRSPFDPSVFQRNFYATSSCGICGKAAIDQVEVLCEPIPPGPSVAAGVIEGLPATLRSAQAVFDETGGLHATGLFDIEGALLAAREDIGRHNAMDKLVGMALLAGEIPARDRIALVSGRASFELVQKAAVAGIPIVCAVSAPSTLAVETAERLGVTLAAFVRDGRFNLYAHPERIAFA
ncbi:MAG: formate dehydrogenase accessory sulfurtransferase FdhD [Gaiellales bacterium]